MHLWLSFQVPRPIKPNADTQPPKPKPPHEKKPLQIAFSKPAPRPIKPRIQNPTPTQPPNNPMLKNNPTFGKLKLPLYVWHGNVVKPTRFGYVLEILAAWAAGLQVVVKPEHLEKLWMKSCLAIWHFAALEWVLGVGAAARTMEKQGRNQNAMTLEGLTPIQPNWEDWGRFVADIYKL